MASDRRRVIRDPWMLALGIFQLLILAAAVAVYFSVGMTAAMIAFGVGSVIEATVGIALAFRKPETKTAPGDERAGP